MNKPTINNNFIRSFGRVNGRKLRNGQASLIEDLLPLISIDIENFSIEKLFPLHTNKLWLEIGFGYGEHLVGMAMKYPDINFIGCEPFVNGVATLLKYIDENKVENIRIFHGDARLLVQKLPASSIERLFILFPDPWPKSKHHKKRIISSSSLKQFARILNEGGKLEIATDHQDYGNWIADHLTNSVEFKPNESIGVTKKPDDWVATRYQEKARQQGRDARFFNYTRSDAKPYFES